MQSYYRMHILTTTYIIDKWALCLYSPLYFPPLTSTLFSELCQRPAATMYNMLSVSVGKLNALLTKLPSAL